MYLPRVVRSSVGAISPVTRTLPDHRHAPHMRTFRISTLFGENRPRNTRPGVFVVSDFIHLHLPQPSFDGLLLLKSVVAHLPVVRRLPCMPRELLLARTASDPRVSPSNSDWKRISFVYELRCFLCSRNVDTHYVLLCFRFMWACYICNVQQVPISRVPCCLVLCVEVLARVIY